MRRLHRIPVSLAAGVVAAVAIAWAAEPAGRSGKATPPPGGAVWVDESGVWTCGRVSGLATTVYRFDGVRREELAVLPRGFEFRTPESIRDQYLLLRRPVAGGTEREPAFVEVAREEAAPGWALAERDRQTVVVAHGFPARCLVLGERGGSVPPTLFGAIVMPASWPLIGGDIYPRRVLWGGMAINAIAYGAAALAIWTGAGALVRLRRRRAGRCALCGYDRAGLDVAAACPECGRGAGG